MTTSIRYDDNRGGLDYPFLDDAQQWEIFSHPLTANLTELPTPTLRWVKDNKVLDLHIAGVETAAFLAQSGLQLSMHKGGYALSKRLSRLMRPYRYFGFFSAENCQIQYDDSLNPQLWDGCGQVSRVFIQRLAASLDLTPRQRHELLHTQRFEVTTLHTGGQDKGHVLVCDNLPSDFRFPAGSAKTEVSLTDGRIFVGLQPIHSDNQMCLDIQSLINLYPFFQPEQLLAWTEMESQMFLSRIRDGQLEPILNRLYNAQSAADIDSLQKWHVGEYIASGGQLMWFSGMVKAVANQHLKRLGSRSDKLRFPVPGGRYYIFPAVVGDRDVPRGQIELDAKTATAWVNDADWLEQIVAVLGGCDGDDALWCFPFTDEDGQQQVLTWRSPNQLGEYVVLWPTEASAVIAWDTAFGTVSSPKMQSRLLPNRIDSTNYQYGSLQEQDDHHKLVFASYTVAGLQSTIDRAVRNRGVLGGFCNVTMLCQAIYGRLPKQLPATMEQIIDSTVKTGADLSPVREWNAMALQRMVQHGQRQAAFGIPQTLLSRLPQWLQPQAVVVKAHWLDTLTQAMAQHQGQFSAETNALAFEACPPVALFEHGRAYMHLGKELRQAYAKVLRTIDSVGNVDSNRGLGYHATVSADSAESSALPVDAVHDRDRLDRYDSARLASESFLQQWPADQHPAILLGAATYLYGLGPQTGEAVRDGLLWQLGAAQPSGRAAGMAQQMVSALRTIGLLGDPCWSASAGSFLYYEDAPCATPVSMPVKLNGIWLNYLNVQTGWRYARMADVPPPIRTEAKAKIATLVQETFQGMQLSTHVTDNDRVITRTPQGNLFGYVQRDHELAAIRHDRWQIAWAHAVDGNLLTVLAPVTQVA